MFKKLTYSFIIVTAAMFAPFAALAQPVAGFTASSIAVCANNPVVTFTNTSTGDVSWAWDFDASNGIQVQSILENPIWNFALFGPGTYTVTLTAYDGVGNSDQFTMTITVWNLPTPAFTPNIPNTSATEGCAPFEVCFTNQSTPGDAPITDWLWVFGNGGSATGPNPCYTYPVVSFGTWSVTLQVVDANGCSDTAIISNLITVHRTPVANFSYATTPGGNLVGCTPADVIQFTDLSTNVNDSIVNWEWNFGDATTGTGPNPTHVYNISGNFNVQLIITDNEGCKDTITKLVRIDDYEANFTASPVTGCDRLVVVFVSDPNTSNIAQPNQFLWNFGDPPSGAQNTSVQNPAAHIYNLPGQYSVTLTSTNAFGCSDDTTMVNLINVFPLPQVGFFGDNLYSCEIPFDVTFTDTTPSAPPGCGTCSWIWDIDNWNPLASPPGYDWSQDADTLGNTDTSIFSHIYTDSIYPVCPPPFTKIDYNVSLIVTDSNGCVDSLVKDIYVSSTEPIAGFIADTSDFLGTPATEGCIPLRVHFRDISTYDTSVVPNDSIVNWYWDFGDGYTISGPDGPIPDSANDCLTSCTFRTPTHFYVQTGIFVVKFAITTAAGCTDTILMYDNCECDPNTGKICFVMAGIPPVPEFAADDTAGCFPFEVNFFDLSSSFANQWYWDFGDGGSSIDQFPTYTYQSETGYFDVSLAASFYGCPSDTLVKDSMIYVDVPQALFNIRPLSGDGAGILILPSTFFCHEDTLPTGGWEASIRDTTVGANLNQDSSFLWVFRFGDPFASTFESVDTTIILVHDTVFVAADTIFIPEDTIFFKAGDITLNSVVCDSDYFIITPADTLYVIADTIPVPNDTIIMKGDYMTWMGKPTDTIILMPDTTITTYTYTIIPSVDTIIDSTFTIYMSEQTTVITEDTIFGCDTNFTRAAGIIIDTAYTVVTTIVTDTLYYIPHDWVGIDTDTTLFQPDTVFYVSRDTIVYFSGNTLVIGTDTLLLAIDTIIINAVSLFTPADTFFVGVDTIPADTTITPPDTACTNPNCIPIDTIYLGGVGGCDTLFILNDTVIKPGDTTITPEHYLAKLLKHTYTTTPDVPVFYPGAPNSADTVKIYTYNSITGCLDSIEHYVNISNVNAGFTINAPFGGDTLGCRPFNAFMQDNTTTIYDIFMRQWNFGDGCTLTTFFPFLDIPVPPDSSCGGLTSGATNTPNHLYPSAGTYTITMLVVDWWGCRDSVSRQVVVKDLPQPIFVADTVTGCANDQFLADLEVTFSDTSEVFQPGQTVQWVWNYGGGLIDTTLIPVAPPHTYNTVGTFNAFLTITDEFGCQSSPQQITITTTRPTPNFIFSPGANCNEGQVSFFAVPPSGAPPLTYTWDWCDGSAVDFGSNSSQTHTFINLDTTAAGHDTTTAFDVTLTIKDANGCMQDTTMPITIQQPVADFVGVTTDIGSVCPSNFAFYDSSSTDASSWSWNFGDGGTSSLQDPTHTYNQPGEYDVTLIISNAAGCIDTMFKPKYIRIKGPVLIDTSMIAICTCAPCMVTFTATGYNTDIFTWFFGDGGFTSDTVNAVPGNPDTVTVTVTYVYEYSGTFYPTLVLEDPLDSTGQRCPTTHFLPPVTIPGPVFDFSTNDTVCGPRDVIFDTINTSGTSVVTSWLWNFDVDGLGGVSPATSTQMPLTDSVSYSNSGSYTVSLTAFVDTCMFTLTKPQYITVFTFCPITVVSCARDSCTPLDVTFTVDTAFIPLNADSLIWVFGDGNSAMGYSVTHTYNNTGDTADVVYDVTAEFKNGCKYVFEDIVTIHPTPVAVFYLDPVVSGVQTAVSIIDSSKGAVSREWDFGDGTVIGPGSGAIINSFNPSGTYEKPFYSYDVPYGESSSYTITLTVYNEYGCSDDTTADKTIELKIPNVFNPGSDKPENRVFFIGDLFIDTLGLSDAVLKLIVFNRWGQKVYEDGHYEDCDPWNAPEKCWDGRDLKGKPLNSDTYYYVLNFNERSVVNGWVMIVRSGK